MFASVFFGVLDSVIGALVYINAGHEPPIVFGAEGLKVTLMPTCPVLGVFSDFEPAVGAAQVEPGDTLFVFTDGVTEAQNSSGELFGAGKLHERRWTTSPLLCRSTGARASNLTTSLCWPCGERCHFDDLAHLSAHPSKERGGLLPGQPKITTTLTLVMPSAARGTTVPSTVRPSTASVTAPPGPARSTLMW
jgi:hypothetical protein